MDWAWITEGTQPATEWQSQRNVFASAARV